MTLPAPVYVSPLDHFKMLAAICVDELAIEWPIEHSILGGPRYKPALDQLKTDLVMRLDQITFLCQVDVYLSQDKVPCASYKDVPILMQNAQFFDIDEFVTKRVIQKLINWNGTFSYMAVVHIGGTTQILYKDV